MKRRTKGFILAVAACSTLAAPHAVLAAAPFPTLHNDNPSGVAGDWYHGATPPNVDLSKPVVLFVQGLHNRIDTTWVRADGNGFYDAAYSQGYRTAFVNFQDADVGGGSNWANGQILANTIQKVRAHYGVDKINIVAYSKGGIDTNTALVHYGAAPYVNVVHQVATPNLGSGLADMSYGFFTWWLAAIIGMRDDATYSLQTSYMANFRAQTDSLPANGLTRTYLSYGTGNDGLFSITWWGQEALLPSASDGAVTVPSALGYPHGVLSFKNNGTQALSHYTMIDANKTWKYIQPKLTTASFAGVRAGMTAAGTDLFAMSPAPESSSSILRGGAVDGRVQDQFELESGIGKISLDVMTASAGTKVKLLAPSGRVYEPVQSSGAAVEGALFAKAVHNSLEIAAPEKGEWKVLLEGENDAYFLMANVEGGMQASVKANRKVLNKHSKTLDLAIDLGGAKGDLAKSKPAKLTKSTKQGKVQKIADVSLRRDAGGSLLANLAVPSEPGVYNLTFDITGTRADGESFTRTLTYNFAVTDESGNL